MYSKTRGKPPVSKTHIHLMDSWDFNKNVKKSHGQLYQETMERIEILKENGYKAIYIWERDFKKL